MHSSYMFLNIEFVIGLIITILTVEERMFQLFEKTFCNSFGLLWTFSWCLWRFALYTEEKSHCSTLVDECCMQLSSAYHSFLFLAQHIPLMQKIELQLQNFQLHAFISYVLLITACWWTFPYTHRQGTGLCTGFSKYFRRGVITMD